MIDLSGTPYVLDVSASDRISGDISALYERIELLRHQGKLNESTLKRYYGEKRFEHVAESNAIEGSTLSIGETRLAVLKGITLTGHDPAYIRDAIALDTALIRLAEMAAKKVPTDNLQLLELHGLILGDRLGGGAFRTEPVTITGSPHKPPKRWKDVMAAMETWERWSKENASAPSVIRATVLHAWLAHIHPFIDGNGRAARAVTNLELVRAGYPPIIIRRKERDRYIDALATSDVGGDIGPFFELVIERASGALDGLELAAREEQGYDPQVARLKSARERRLKIWNTSVSLLYQRLLHDLEAILEPLNGQITSKQYEELLELGSYIQLCEGVPVSRSWSFSIKCVVPGLSVVERLAWFGYRSHAMEAVMRERANEIGGPSIFWSSPNPGGYPRWVREDSQAPNAIEMTTVQAQGDDWYVMTQDGDIRRMSTTDLARFLADGFVGLLGI